MLFMDRQETNAINSYVIELIDNKQISWFPSTSGPQDSE